MKTFDVPVLFITYRRAETTLKVLESIAAVKPERLFISSNAPNPLKENDAEKVMELRSLIEKRIDWPCKVEKLYRTEHVGAGVSIASAVTWFFENVEEGIILEDDTLPDPSFFNYCKMLLSHFRNDRNVFLISGDNFQDSKIRGDGTYYFSKYPSSWGYASWRRAFEGYDFTLASIDPKRFDELLDQQFSHEDEKEHWRKIYHDLDKGKYDTWDFQFMFNMWQKKGVGVIPNINLISNIGFGNNATHTTHADSPAANKPVGSIHKIVHPTSRNIDQAADRYLFNTFIKGESTWQRRFRKLKNLFKGLPKREQSALS